MAKELVLVTGASGFIGTHTIIQLLEQRYRVRGTVRDTSRSSGLLEMLRGHAPEGSSIELVNADLTKDAGWDEAVAGCEFVQHIASPILLKLPKDRDALVGPARDGALRVLRAAKAAGCKRVVMTSSLAAVGYSPDKTQTREYTEEDWTDPDYEKLNAYLRSKTLSEKAAWEYVEGEGRGLELAVVNPGLVLGPVLENDIGVSAEVVKQLMSGEIPMYPRIGFPVVDVRDVARCHILAMTTPEAAGERFVCAGDFLWFEDIGRIVQEAYPDRKLPKRRMPNWLVRFAAIFNSALAQTLEDLGRVMNVSHAKATRILGWKPGPAREAVLATAESLIERKIV